MKQFAVCLVLAAGLLDAAAANAVDVQAYVRKDAFNDLTLSPNGDYYAATVPLEDRTIRVVLRRSDNKITARVAGEKNSHIDDFHWVNPERIVVSMAEKFGSLDNPQLTGELYAVNADGSGAEMLVGGLDHLERR